MVAKKIDGNKSHHYSQVTTKSAPETQFDKLQKRIPIPTHKKNEKLVKSLLNRVKKTTSNSDKLGAFVKGQFKT